MLILASQSETRRAMLAAAGIPFMAVPARVDERAIESGLGGVPAADVALALARAKALAVAALHPGRLVLGSDSLARCDGQRFDKPRDRAEAAAHLRFFAGKVIELYSAAALAHDDVVIWQHAAAASLHVIEMSDDFIDDYLMHEWPAVAGCVGVFRIEGRGVQLFKAIDGDHFTVLGMPLLPLLAALRERGKLGR